MNSIFKNNEWQTSIAFSNGEFVVSKKQLPWKAKAIEKAYHGDLKTVAIRDKFVGLQKDEVVSLVNIWRNFHGLWARVQNEKGEYIDVRPYQLEIISV